MLNTDDTLRTHTRSRPVPVGHPVKILILSDWHAPAVNGVVTSVNTLRRGLAAQGHEVRVLASGDRRGTTFDGQVYQIASVGVGALYPSARLGKPLDRAVLEHILDWGPDIVHSHTEFVAFMWARRIAEQLALPHVHTYHTVYEDYTHYFSPSRRFGRRVAATLTRKVLGSTDLVIVPTAKVETLLRRYDVPAGTRVIPTGVDLERFTCQAPSGGSHAPDELRRRLRLPQDVPVVLYVGRLAQEKNLTETLGLLGGMLHLDWRFVVVGGGPYEPGLRNLAGAGGLADRVVFTGAVDPEVVSHYYRLGDVFVSSSRTETQGLTYIEALASGVPMLCRADPVIDGVVVDGVNGYQYRSPAQFTARLTELLTRPDLRRRLAEGARHTSLRFSEEAFATAVLEAYLAGSEEAHRRRGSWMGHAA